MTHRLTIPASLVIAVGLAACSGQSGSTVPQTGSIAPQAHGANVTQQVATASAQKRDFGQRGTNAEILQKIKAGRPRQLPIPGCTTITSGPFINDTAAVVLTGTQTVDVNGAGCDIAVYVPSGSDAHLDSINVYGASIYQAAVDPSATLHIYNTNVTDYTGAYGVESFGNLHIYNSTVRQDGSEIGVDIEGGTAKIGRSSIFYGLNQGGLYADGGTTDIDNSDVLEHDRSVTGSFIFPVAVVGEFGGALRVLSGTISANHSGFGVVYFLGGYGSVDNTLVRGDGIDALLLDNPGSVSINDTTARLTGHSLGFLNTCPFGPSPCAPFTLKNTTAVGDGTTGSPSFFNDSIGFAFHNPGFTGSTVYQNVSRNNGIGYVAFCIFPSTAAFQAFLNAGGNQAFGSIDADALAVNASNRCGVPNP
ncbi:MAG: hypothetical protein JO322_00510 [Candidatus Eremiobacteraeota bacterium]|nr:hypothetical protein [Candidatus Eremiobacteraeota bacterium]